MNPIEVYAYPQYAVMIAILIGCFLAVFNPRMLFFVVFAGVVLTDLRSYAFTRFEITGPYLNVFDLLVVFGLFSSFLQSRSDRQPIHFLWYIVLADLLLGFMLSYMQFGLNFDVLRATRAALNVPLLWFIGYRCINTREDACTVLYIVLFGCFIQSVRQCLYVAFSENTDAHSWRTIRFMHAGYVLIPFCFLLSSFSKSVLLKVFLYASVGVSMVALILTQTRSFLIPQVLLILIGGWILARIKLIRFLLPSAAFLIVSAMIFYYLVPNQVDIADLFLHGRINDFSSGHGREAAIYQETKVWLNGNVIFGQGLGYYYSFEYANMDEVAWGHNGYTAFLSNLGFFGFVLFGILIPRFGLLKSRINWNSNHEEIKLFGLVAGSLVWFLIIESALTPGLLSGMPYSLNLIFLGGASSLANQTIESHIGVDEAELARS